MTQSVGRVFAIEVIAGAAAVVAAAAVFTAAYSLKPREIRVSSGPLSQTAAARLATDQWVEIEQSEVDALTADQQRRTAQDKAMLIRASTFLTPGQIALERDGQIVWVGALGAPIEDVEFTTLLVSDADFDDIKRQNLDRHK